MISKLIQVTFWKFEPYQIYFLLGKQQSCLDVLSLRPVCQAGVSYKWKMHLEVLQILLKIQLVLI